MGIKFVWEDAYSVGNDKIDNQHKGLFALTNSLPEENICKKEMMKYVLKLFRYTRIHFADEENIMETAGYPKLSSHIAIHDDIITQLGNLNPDELDTSEAANKLKQFLYDWIAKHIMQHDQEFFAFVKKNNINIPADTKEVIKDIF